MIIAMSPGEAEKIAAAAETAAHKAFSRPAQSEPQLVANLVWHLPNELNKISLASGRSLQASGVFVHAQPLVSSPLFTKSSVEIGDLLLIRTFTSGNKVRERRAMLLQAKKASGFSVKPANDDQHLLYADWPSFTYVKAGALTGKRRKITGHGMNSAAKYFLLGTEPSFSCCWCASGGALHPPAYTGCKVRTAEATKPTLSGYECFYKEVVDFIAGNSGRAYEYPSRKRTRGWDRVIQDLVDSTSKRASVYMRRATGKYRPEKDAADRGVFCFLAGSLEPSAGHIGQEIDRTVRRRNSVSMESIGGYQGPPEIPAQRDFDGDTRGGISIVEFVVNDEDWWSERL